MKNLIKKCVKSFGVLTLAEFLSLGTIAYAHEVSKKESTESFSLIKDSKKLETLILGYDLEEKLIDKSQTFDSEEETGYTHLEGILSNVRETEAVESLSFDEALKKTLGEMEKFQYLKDDGVEHLQSPEETLSRADGDYRGKGDCEDFTNYFLWRMKQYGVPLERLGIIVLNHPDLNQGFLIEPIAKNEEGRWVYMITGNPGFCPNDSAKDYVFRRQLPINGMVGWVIYGLHQDAKIIKSEEYKKDEEYSLKKIQESGLEKDLKKRGLINTVIHPEIENGYTHIKRIRGHARETEVIENLGFYGALGKTLGEMEKFKYMKDGVEHLQSPEETLSRADGDYRGKGDCEDFTNYFLWRMKQYGVPLERLGVCVATDDAGKDHMLPIAKDDRGEWIYMETDEPGPGICFYKSIENYVFHLSSLRIYGLHEEGQVVKRERYKNDEKLSFKEFQRLTEEELTKKGYATD